MRTSLITALLFTLLATASAQSTLHLWSKMSEHLVTNQYGQQVKQCTWQCQAPGHGNHTTVTQGFGPSFCPMP